LTTGIRQTAGAGNQGRDWRKPGAEWLTADCV